MFEEEMRALKGVYIEKIKDDKETISYISPQMVGCMKRFVELYERIQQNKYNLQELNDKIDEEFGGDDE